MTTELIINSTLPETRIALLEENEIQELLIEHEADRGIVGNIYKGKVTRVLPGMQAAFVDIGLEKAAFLYVDDVYVHTEIVDEDGKETVSASVSLEGEDDYDDIDDEIEVGVATEGEDGENLEASMPAHTENISKISEDETKQEVKVETQSDTDPEEKSADSEEKEFDPRLSDEGKGDEPREVSDDSGESKTLDKDTSVDSSESKAEPQASSSIQSDEDRAKARTPQPRSTSYQRNRSPRSGDNRGRRGGSHRGRPAGRGGYRDRVQRTNVPYPKGSYNEPINTLESDRNTLTMKEGGTPQPRQPIQRPYRGRRPEFQGRRDRNRRVHPKKMQRQKPNVNIQDLLKEGQEVIVQVAKDPIAAKGARLTCHMSLAGRHLVCMPTIDHVGVSRRIEREDERRSLRDFVLRERPQKMGFIVRTASGGKNPEHWIQQDMDYLAKLWNDIAENSKTAKAPARIYEDLNPALRAVRDWVSEDVKRIVIDSKEEFNDIKDFVSKFMPEIQDRVEFYQGDIPIFDAYGLSTELHRSLERKVWLKSGGYIVIDQAEALVAIDVNTGRYVGKKNLEDTIFKTNVEAVEEIAFQLRLRNCGGIIIIDLIDMEEEENRRRVYRALESAIQKDRARPTIMSVSKLGLIEMTRKRTRDTMVRALCESCSHCEAKGFIKSKRTVAYEVFREIEREGLSRDFKKILVQAHPDVIDTMAVDEERVLTVLEKRYRKEIYLQAVFDFHQEQYEVTGDTAGSRRSTTTRRGARPSQNRTPKGRGNLPRPRSGPRKSEDQGLTRVQQTSASNEVKKLEVDGSNPKNRDDQVPPDDRKSENINQAVSSADSMEEEDRLAYLRAQAAQDAALANNSSSKSAEMTSRSRAGRPNSRPSNRGNSRGRGGRGVASRNSRGVRGGGRRPAGGRGPSSGYQVQPRTSSASPVYGKDKVKISSSGSDSKPSGSTSSDPDTDRSNA